jgi:hypothetical protein
MQARRVLNLSLSFLVRHHEARMRVDFGNQLGYRLSRIHLSGVAFRYPCIAMDQEAVRGRRWRGPGSAINLPMAEFR